MKADRICDRCNRVFSSALIVRIKLPIDFTIDGRTLGIRYTKKDLCHGCWADVRGSIWNEFSLEKIKGVKKAYLKGAIGKTKEI